MKVAAICVFFAFILSAYFMISDQNRSAIFDQEGVIWSGSKFGVYVDHSTSDATSKLNSTDWRLDDVSDGGNCVRHHYAAIYKIFGFRDRSWRNGSLCLISRDNVVKAIEWYFAPFTPEL